MGREIRKVPKGWEHPKDENHPEHYQPLHDEYYLDALKEWFKGHELWEKGEHPNQKDGSCKDYRFYAEYEGDPPDIKYYRQINWTDEDANCFQMYETVSEGTPVSPVFETLKDLENWLVKQGHTRKAAAAFCESGWVPSMMFNSGTGQMFQGIDIYNAE